MTDPNVTPIDELLWTATRYSDVLRLDRRAVAQALETAPFQTRNGHRVWHLRDGMPAIFQRVGGGAKANDPDLLAPKDALDYYRAQREKIKLEIETGESIPSADVERMTANAFKSLAQSLESLPDDLERNCGLDPLTVNSLQRAVDDARERLYTNLIADLLSPETEKPP